MKLKNFLMLLLLSFAGCTSSSVRISEVHQSLAEIRKSVQAIMGEPRSVSTNGRTFTSPYFSRKAATNAKSEDPSERLYAVLTVLGDRRPYDIKVQVFSEEKEDNGRYSERVYEPELSAKIAKEFEERLNQSRKDMNIIDDFRAF